MSVFIAITALAVTVGASTVHLSNGIDHASVCDPASMEWLMMGAALAASSNVDEMNSTIGACYDYRARQLYSAMMTLPGADWHQRTEERGRAEGWWVCPHFTRCEAWYETALAPSVDPYQELKLNARRGQPPPLHDSETHSCIALLERCRALNARCAHQQLTQVVHRLVARAQRWWYSDTATATATASADTAAQGPTLDEIMHRSFRGTVNDAWQALYEAERRSASETLQSTMRLVDDDDDDDAMIDATTWQEDIVSWWHDLTPQCMSPLVVYVTRIDYTSGKRSRFVGE